MKIISLKKKIEVVTDLQNIGHNVQATMVSLEP